MSNFVVSGPKFTGLFSQNAGRIAIDRMFFFQFWISSSVPEIFAIKLKLFEIAPNFARIGFYIFGKDLPPPNFGTWIIKRNQLPIMRQSFTVIGRGSSEISR